MLLLINNISSYLDDLKECLNKTGAKYNIQKYDELNGHSISNYKGIILSGRTNSVKEMNVSNMQTIRTAYKEDRPLLGICYGAEIMALAFNGSLQRLNERIVGDNAVTVKENNLLTNRKSLNVFESHGYHIARLPHELTCVADSINCKYEIIAHANKHMFGTQFHPELSRDGMEILNNFIRLTKS
ncbi:MAG: gamma-glutamyl-gamma-aminobutyrate hydrolase family protein [Nitrososphaerales archaeon]